MLLPDELKTFFNFFLNEAKKGDHNALPTMFLPMFSGPGRTLSLQSVNAGSNRAMSSSVLLKPGEALFRNWKQAYVTYVPHAEA